MNVVVGSGRAEHRPGRRAALFLGIVVMLDSYPAEQRVEMVRDVAGGIDVRRGRPAQLVHEQAIVLRGWRAGHGGHIRIYPDARDGEVAGYPEAAGGPGRLQPPGALERGDLLPGQQLDAVRAVVGADHRANLLAQDPLKRNLARKDGGHVHPELGQRGCYLAADEAHAHDDRAPAWPGLALDRVAVGNRAQVMEAGQVGPRYLKPPVPSSRRYQELVVPEFLTRVQQHRVPGGVNAQRGGLAQALDLVLFVPAGGPDVPSVEILFRTQVCLGERRPAKRDARFRADEHDPAPVALLPQRHGGAAPGHAAADDHDRAAAGAVSHRVVLLPSRAGRGDSPPGRLCNGRSGTSRLVSRGASRQRATGA